MLYVTPDGSFQGESSGGTSALPDIRGTGVLMFNGKCAYLHSLVLEETADVVRAPSGRPEFVYFLRLGYNATLFDPNARALWVNQVGPMFEGDRVAFDGFYGKHWRPTFWCPLATTGRIATATLMPAP